MHPDSSRLALLVHAVDEDSGRLVVNATREMMMPGGVPIASGPAIIAFRPTFDRDQWPVLLTLLRRRVVLPNEDCAALASTGADSLAKITVDAIQGKQSLDR